VCCSAPEAWLRRLLEKETLAEWEQAALLQHVQERGSLYLPRTNAFYVQDFQMMYAAEEAARFVHRACRGPAATGEAEPADHFYVLVLEHALAFFGSRVLYPARAAVRGEAETWSRAAWDEMARSLADAANDETQAQIRETGYAMGSSLYDRYLKGDISRAGLR